ncbi:MAG: TIGR02206 family membrane protein [Phycisphaerales bacterium]
MIFSPTQFAAFTSAHLIVASICFTLIIGSAVLGRRWRGTRRETRLRFAWIWFTIAWQSMAVVWYLLPSHFDPHVSLPLHLCDVAAWLAPFALWSKRRFPMALLYFWGVGLSTQAFFTPVLRQGYATMEFWMFWVGHLQIVGSAVYVVAVLGLRPTWKDLARSIACSAVVLGGVILANELIIPAAFGCEPSNYWYVGNLDTGARTIIDALGPWPWRIGWIVLLGSTAMTLAWIPWAIAGAIKRTRAGTR